MKRNLARLSENVYDVLIIGGGIYGLFTAWDAALRGLSVALVEKGDFGHATSSSSQRVIHGGLRFQVVSPHDDVPGEGHLLAGQIADPMLLGRIGHQVIDGDLPVLNRRIPVQDGDLFEDDVRDGITFSV